MGGEENDDEIGSRFCNLWTAHQGSLPIYRYFSLLFGGWVGGWVTAFECIFHWKVFNIPQNSTPQCFPIPLSSYLIQSTPGQRAHTSLAIHDLNSAPKNRALSTNNSPLCAPPQSKKQPKRYEDRDAVAPAGSNDEPLDDPVAEKLRQQRCPYA